MDTPIPTIANKRIELIQGYQIHMFLFYFVSHLLPLLDFLVLHKVHRIFMMQIYCNQQVHWL